MSWTWSFQIVDLVPVQLRETGKRAQRIEVVVENRDFHEHEPPGAHLTSPLDM